MYKLYLLSFSSLSLSGSSFFFPLFFFLLYFISPPLLNASALYYLFQMAFIICFKWKGIELIMWKLDQRCFCINIYGFGEDRFSTTYFSRIFNSGKLFVKDKMNNKLESKHQQVQQPLLELGTQYRKWSYREKEITTRGERKSRYMWAQLLEGNRVYMREERRKRRWEMRGKVQTKTNQS